MNNILKAFAWSTLFAVTINAKYHRDSVQTN
jgi:hypothetical protein